MKFVFNFDYDSLSPPLLRPQATPTTSRVSDAWPKQLESFVIIIRAISVSLSVSIDTIRYNHIIIPTWWHPLTPAVSDLLRPVRSLECALALGVTYGVLLGSLYSLLPTLSSSLLPAPLCLLSYSNFVFLWLFHSILLPLAFNQFLQHNAYSSFLQ